MTVIVVVPAPTGVTCPDDEFTVATLVLLLEYDKTPALTVVIKLDKEKGESVVDLFGIFAKERVGTALFTTSCVVTGPAAVNCPLVEAA